MIIFIQNTQAQATARGQTDSAGSEPTAKPFAVCNINSLPYERFKQGIVPGTVCDMLPQEKVTVYLKANIDWEVK